MLLVIAIFFLSSRRRHTRFDCDWSSDVCSSDLSPDLLQTDLSDLARLQLPAGLGLLPVVREADDVPATLPRRILLDRKSVVLGKRVDLGGRRIIKKKIYRDRE